mgnify:CR=1 FL=1
MPFGYNKYSLEELNLCSSSFNKHPFIGVSELQLYNPLYRNFFQLNENNAIYTTLNHRNRILKVIDTTQRDEIDTVDCRNHFKIQTWNHLKDEKETRNSFFKFCPLMEPVKYMLGKYENLQSRTEYDIYRLPTFYNGSRQELTSQQKTSRKIDSTHNSAYVDGFFSYLTSIAKHDYNFIHGIEYYGSFLGKQSSFAFDAIDELEYLNESDFFHNNKSTFIDPIENQCSSRFIIDPKIYAFDEESRKNRKPLNIDDNVDTLSVQSIHNSMFCNIFDDDDDNVAVEKVEKSDSIKITNDISNLELLWQERENGDGLHPEQQSCENGENGENDAIDNVSIETTDTEEDEDSSEEHSINNECDSDDDGNTDVTDETEESSDNDEDDEDDEDHEELWVHIKNFPVNVICLEAMDGTLDKLMEEDALDTQEWTSCLIQVIFQLIAYQKMFAFTHNDLHTNNIMYIETERKYLIYRFDGKLYRVPTYGRIFKIIDFGRAIYQLKGVRICSDSYHCRGDAATQYNTEPFFNPNKPRVEPNYAFDLARLGCSLYDFFIGDIEEEHKFVSPLDRMVIDWCRDDNNKNLLYLSNGDERYPGFKLYKMIARKCSRNTPQAQLKRHDIFQQYQISKKKLSKNLYRQIMNLDTLPDLSIKHFNS